MIAWINFLLGKAMCRKFYTEYKSYSPYLELISCFASWHYLSNDFTPNYVFRELCLKSPAAKLSYKWSELNSESS